MEPLSFPENPDQDDERLLNADQQAVAQRELREMVFGLSHLLKQLTENGTMHVGTTRAVFSLAESRLVDIAKLVGIEIHTQVEQEDRYARIRAANLRIHELERQLGAAVTPAVIQMGIQSVCERLNKWWDQRGFGYIGDLRLTQYGHIEANFSCMLTGAWALTGSKTPISDKEAKALWIASLAERGFALTDDDGDPGILDCDKSRQAMQRLFADIPSASIVSTTNHVNRHGSWVMRDAKVYIRKLEDIEALVLAADDED